MADIPYKSSGGSGGGSEIGDVKPLYVDDVNGLYINGNDEHWLRTGVIETDVASYPNAKQVDYFDTTTSEVTVNISAQLLIARDITAVAAEYYVLDDAANNIEKYDTDGTHIGSLTLFRSDADQRGSITSSSTHLFVTRGQNTRGIEKYPLTAGSYESFYPSSSLVGQDLKPQALFFAEGYLYAIYNISNEGRLVKIDPSSNAKIEETTITFPEGLTASSVRSAEYYNGIVYLNNYSQLILMELSQDTLRPMDVTFSFNTPNNVGGMAMDSTGLYVVTLTAKDFVRHPRLDAVGMLPSVFQDDATPYYTRIK